MKNTLIDISHSDSPDYIELLSLVDKTAREEGLKYFLAGALVRDIVLGEYHGIEIARKTNDADIAVALSTWTEFDRFRACLLQSEDVSPTRVDHRLIFKAVTPIDLMPFGKIESPDREIQWPDDEGMVMNMLGYAESAKHTLDVKLAKDLVIQCVDLPHYASLKLIAWNDRYFHAGITKDAEDFGFLASHYLDAGNSERFFEECTDILERPDFDYGVGGAQLLARDMKREVCEGVSSFLLKVLERGLDDETGMPLVQGMAKARNQDFDSAARLLQAFCDELNSKTQ